jgi:pimeloyl-ACP methyl ester carboxylesterase
MAALSRPTLRQRTPITPLLLTAAISFLLGTLYHSASLSKKPLILPSPLHTHLPSLSPSQQSQLPYPPDALPGARDVPTPYGSIRVYEFGPPSGQKVLLIHGVSTPSLALGAVANGLVEKGCRVMLFDLFGRGYSDSPDDLPQDKRLWATQILLALASSEISWFGKESGKFALIGFSMGGGIAANFTSYFPALVGSLVLLAPSGLVRKRRFTARTRILYSTGILPEWLLKILVARRLREGPSAAKSATPYKVEAPGAAPITQELPKSSFYSASLSKAHPDLTVAKAVEWQVDTHAGFVRAFMSSIRYAPVTGQQEDWERIGRRLTSQKRAAEESMIDVRDVEGEGLREGKVLVIAGRKDEAIVEGEIFEDAKRAFEGNVVFKSVDAGHEFPITRSEEVVGIVWEFWSGDSN